MGDGVALTRLVLYSLDYSLFTLSKKKTSFAAAIHAIEKIILFLQTLIKRHPPGALLYGTTETTNSRRRLSLSLYVSVSLPTLSSRTAPIPPIPVIPHQFFSSEDIPEREEGDPRDGEVGGCLMDGKREEVGGVGVVEESAGYGTKGREEKNEG